MVLLHTLHTHRTLIATYVVSECYKKLASGEQDCTVSFSLSSFTEYRFISIVRKDQT